MDRPHLIPLDIRPDQDSACIILRGLGSQEKRGVAAHSTWVSQLRALGFQGSIYQYWWDSSPYTFTYNKVKSRAKEVGQYYFADDIAQCPEKKIHIVAHSMGCRIPYHAIQMWEKTGSSHPLQGRLQHCIFLGGYIKRDSSRPWNLFPKYFCGHIFNLYNRKDKTLKSVHKTFGRFFASPCGRKPIEFSHPKIHNIEITSIGKSHSDYINVLATSIPKHVL